MTDVPEFQISGAFMRAYYKTLVAQAMLEPVLDAIRVETRDFLAEPPSPWTWFDAEHGLNVLDALLTISSREHVKLFGLKLAQLGLGPVLTPLVRTVLALSSASPRPLAVNLGFMMKPFLRGVQFVLEDRGPTAFLLTLNYPRPIGVGNFIAWEGLLHYAFELTGKRGVVTRAPCGPTSAVAIYDVSWTP